VATVTAPSVSSAWKQVLSLSLQQRGHELCPLTVEVTCGGEPDDPKFRHQLNRILASSGKASVETVARTIFPIGLWNPQESRSRLYDRYYAILRKLHKYPANARGLYFERLIKYPLEKHTKTFSNQLEFIISTYTSKRNHRRSALQASLYNPFVDASNSPRLGFPCLHQLAFIPSDNEQLTIAAFYPLHYIFERAYGNYLGLIYLGRFMAKEMGLELARLVCVASIAKLEAVPQRLKSLNLSGN
jgi:hypothetical protein